MENTMKMVSASVMKIPPSAIRPVVTRELYPPPVPRPAPPLVNPLVNAPVPRQPPLTAPASIPEALLRRAIREELRELSAEQAAQVRARAQRFSEAQSRVQERREEREPRARHFVNDPWDNGFGQEESAASSTEVVPASQAMPAPAVAPLTPMPSGTPQTAIVVSDGYGPLAQMSRNLRIQAADGFRAGVIRLKNGMFLVVEIAQEALEPEFGVAEVLAPLVFNAAARALEDPETQQALINVASQGADAVGRGLQALTQHARRPHVHHSHAPHAHARPHPLSRPVARPPAQPTPAYAPWPGQYLPPGYLPWQASQAQTRTPQPPLRPESLPWADEQDFAGLLDDSERYVW